MNDLTFVVTFPVVGPLRNCYTTISAPSELEARLMLMDEYGREGWAGIYRPDEKARVIDQYGLQFVPFGPVVPQRTAEFVEHFATTDIVTACKLLRPGGRLTAHGGLHYGWMPIEEWDADEDGPLPTERRRFPVADEPSFIDGRNI